MTICDRIFGLLQAMIGLVAIAAKNIEDRIRGRR